MEYFHISSTANELSLSAVTWSSLLPLQCEYVCGIRAEPSSAPLHGTALKRYSLATTLRSRGVLAVTCN